MDVKNSPFLARLDAVAADTEALLDRLLAPTLAAGELSRPARLLEAMRYTSLGGGKRFRPFLVVESANLFKVTRENALMAGAALECVHCYSLVHDDLPAMDNDELRRGQPTAHRKFDEATASSLSARSPVPPASAAWPAARCSTSPRRDASARKSTAPATFACCRR
jgi:farnesyl diphosphate synthase